MKSKFIDAGKIVNTHGIRGEVKIVPWCDSAEFLRKYKNLYIGGQAMKVTASRVHKDNLLVQFEGVTDINDAMRLKDKVVQIDKEEIKLPEGTHFIDDLIGLAVVDSETKETVGRITDVLSLPANDVYVVKGQREYMIPAVPAFIVERDIPGGTVTVKMQEGLATDED